MVWQSRKSSKKQFFLLGLRDSLLSYQKRKLNLNTTETTVTFEMKLVFCYMQQMCLSNREKISSQDKKKRTT